MPETESSDAHVPASPERTWEALTDGEALGEWLADGPGELDPTPGGELRLTVDERERTGFVEEADPARRLVFWWSETEQESSRVELELEPDGDGTRVRVTETRPLERLTVEGIELATPRGRGDGGGAAPRMLALA